MMTPCLVLQGVSKTFGGLLAVNAVTLEVYPGDRKGLIGPNGAGKTTLFNLITGTLQPTSGRIVLFGQDITTWPTYRRTALGMARTFQITTLFPKLTVLDNVLLAVQGLRTMKFVMWRPLTAYRAVYAKAQALLEQVGYWDRRDVEIRHLSHGEQRQIEIVLALAGEPQVLLLDEPAAGLSTGESHDMATFVQGLDANLAILMIEHDMDVAFAVVDSIVVLHYGEIIEEGSGELIRTSTRVRDIYLGTGCVVALLEVQDIHTSYGDSYVLQGLSLELRKGQILGVLGRNGVGKTTLVNSIVGFTPPRRGRVLFQEEDVTHVPSFSTVRLGMGLVPQGRRVFPSLSVEENLTVAESDTRRHGWNLERVYAMFPCLAERCRQRAKTLSGGEQQMLAIGRGLMTNPDCLLMDEPSEGLAPIIIQHVWDVIAQLRKEGLSILLVEQNVALALKLVDYVHVISKGQIVYSSNPQDLWANEDVKARYLGI